MIVEYIRYALPAQDAEGLIAAYAEAAALLDESENCLGWDIAQCEEDPGSIVVRMHWDSAQGHLSGFRAGPLFPPFLALVRPYFAQIAEMRHYVLRGGSGVGPGGEGPAPHGA